MDLILLILTIVLTPLVFCPLKSCDGFILPQIGIGSIGISLALLFFVYDGILPINLSVVLALLYFVYLMTSSTWSTAPHNSLRDVPLILLSVGGFVLAYSLFFVSKNNMVAVSLGVFFVSMCVSLYGIGQKFLFDPLFPERLYSRRKELEELIRNFGLLKEGEDFEKEAKVGKLDYQLPKFFNNRKWADGRCIASLGNTNFASGYFCSTLPFLIYLGIEVNGWFFLSMLVPIIAVIFTESRAGLLSLVVGLLFFLIFVSQRGLVFDFLFNVFANMQLELLVLIMILTVYFGAEFLIRTHAIWKNLSKDTWLNNTLDVERTHQDHPVAHLRFRFRYWRAAWELIKKKPLQGFGLRTYRKEVYLAQADLNRKDGGAFLGEGYQTPQPRECHNDFIENFVEGGFTSGLLFLAIIGVIFYNAIDYANTASYHDFILVAGVASGLVVGMVNAFFFFPLRLGSSALTFWVGLALLNAIWVGQQSIIIFQFPCSYLLVFFVLLSLTALNWEGTLKPNIGNFLFAKSQWAGNPSKKEKYLGKASDYCPKETLFATHRYFGYLDTFDDEADQCADVMKYFYDGMTPAWTMFFNAAVAKIKKKNYGDAVRLLNHSLYHLPYYQPAIDILRKIYSMAPFPRRGVNMKRVKETTLRGIDFFEADIKVQESMIQANRERIVSLILSEKVEMNIPPNWLYDFRGKVFTPPTQVPEGGQIVEIGVAKLPAIIYPNNPQTMEIKKND